MASSMHKRGSANQHGLSQGLHDIGSAARDLAAESAGALRDHAADYLEHGRDRVRDFEENVETRISEHPFRSLLLAGAIGFVVGMICSRR